MYYVYVLKNQEGKGYIGYISNLKRRIEEHNKGESTSTRGHNWILVYYEAYLAEKDARNREQQLKKSGQARRWLKERIVNSVNLSKES